MMFGITDRRIYYLSTNCIRKAVDTAYLHHIERLMIVGNFMVLSEISPQEGHRWFMEFAIDNTSGLCYKM